MIFIQDFHPFLFCLMLRHRLCRFWEKKWILAITKIESRLWKKGNFTFFVYLNLGVPVASFRFKGNVHFFPILVRNLCKLLLSSLSASRTKATAIHGFSGRWSPARQLGPLPSLDQLGHRFTVAWLLAYLCFTCACIVL